MLNGQTEEIFIYEIYQKYHNYIYCLIKSSIKKEKHVIRCLEGVFLAASKNYYKLREKGEDEVKVWLIDITIEVIKKYKRRFFLKYRYGKYVFGRQIDHGEGQTFYDLDSWRNSRKQQLFLEYINVSLDQEELEFYRLRYQDCLSVLEISKIVDIGVWEAYQKLKDLKRRIHELKISFKEVETYE